MPPPRPAPDPAASAPGAPAQSGTEPSASGAPAQSRNETSASRGAFQPASEASALGLEPARRSADDAAPPTPASQEQPLQPLRRPHGRPLVCGGQVRRLKNLGLPLKGPFYGRGERGLLGSARQTRSHMVPAPRSASAPPWIFRGAEEAP